MILPWWTLIDCLGAAGIDIREAQLLWRRLSAPVCRNHVHPSHDARHTTVKMRKFSLHGAVLCHVGYVVEGARPTAS
jgi:hypothetical protein